MYSHFKVPLGGGTPQPVTANVNTLAHGVSPSSLSHALIPSQNPSAAVAAAAQQQLAAQLANQQQGGGPGATQQQRVPGGGKKGPYGSGDADDGYTLVFESMAAFQAWRAREEEDKMVEFVKGDTHGSKAVPPRFKDHTKLVCARHTRSGRKKYVKKYPDRVRKVPSRKLEGVGCPASISYKTYFDTDEVRACYMADHSHEIGLANLPFTRRGRKAAADASTRRRGTRATTEGGSDSHERSASPPGSPPSPAPNLPGPSNQVPHVAPPQQQPHPPPTFQSAIMGIAQPAPHPHTQLEMSQERWDRMAVLFQNMRDHARTFEFPPPSVAALESVLIRLYLESPMGGGAMNGG